MWPLPHLKRFRPNAGCYAVPQAVVLIPPPLVVELATGEFATARTRRQGSLNILTGRRRR